MSKISKSKLDKDTLRTTTLYGTKVSLKKWFSQLSSRIVVLIIYRILCLSTADQPLKKGVCSEICGREGRDNEGLSDHSTSYTLQCVTSEVVNYQ